MDVQNVSGMKKAPSLSEIIDLMGEVTNFICPNKLNMCYK